MRSIRSMLLILAGLLALTGGAAAADAKKGTKEPAKPSAAPAVLKLSPGQAVKLDGFEIALNKVVQPGADGSLGGNLFTEYNFTVTNTTQEKELTLSNAALTVTGDLRQMIRDLDEIAFQDMSDRSTAAIGGSAAVGFVSGMLGPIAALGGQLLAHKGASKLLVDDPQKWREELKKKSFQGTEAGAVIFPADTVTGSIWFKQAAAEVAERIQVYVKQGNVARVLRFELADMPTPVSADKTAKAE